VEIIRILLELYVVVLIIAALMSWFPTEPDSHLAVARRAIGTVTDPPLRLIRRIIPSITLGGTSLDLSVIVLIIIIEIVISII